jgi:hypothetical protein
LVFHPLDREETPFMNIQHLTSHLALALVLAGGFLASPWVQASSIQHHVQLKPVARNYMETGDYQKALLLLQRWHDTAPEDMEALFYLSQALLETGDVEGSQQALEKLHLLAPHSSWAKAATLWKAEHPRLAMNPLQQRQNMALVSVALNPAISPVVNTTAPALGVSMPITSFDAPRQNLFETAYAPEAPVATPAMIRYGMEPKAPVVKPPSLPEPLPLFKEATYTRRQVQGVETPVPPSVQTQRLNPKPTPTSGRNTPPTTPYTKVLADKVMTDVASDSSKQPLASPGVEGAVPTQEELARNMQTLQQMMMIQMMANISGNATGSNPYASLMGAGGGASNSGMMGNMPMMMQMMQAQQGGASMPGGMNPAMFSQMMQSSMLNNMNDMFNSTNKNDENDNGFGF